MWRTQLRRTPFYLASVVMVLIPSVYCVYIERALGTGSTSFVQSQLVQYNIIPYSMYTVQK